MEAILNIILFLVILTVAYFVGTTVERMHYHEINEREAELLTLLVVTSENICEEDDIVDAKLIYGSVVISLDYFKRFLAKLRNIFGGELSSYASLIDRGRREAILRMKESCPEADAFLNLRIETSTISSGKGKSVGCVELVAFSTAVQFKA